MSTPNVDENETLYRQVGPGGNPIYFDPERTPVVHQSRFLPTSQDADGLSLIRSRFRTEVWSAYRKEQPAVRFRLAVLHAHSLQQLASESGFETLSYGLNADGLDEDHGQPWAHCVVLQINRADYDGDADAKKRIKKWAMRVATLLTQQDVIGPFDEPTSQDPYRPANLQA